ncbi:MAG: Dabb family protein [Alphaproteobacteria bacterium]|nr:Dabb family protein [Alphaproteobacteria bacterium]
MFTHVVLFKTPDRDAANVARAALYSMRGRVPGLQDIEVGIDEGGGPRSWSLCLITRFADAEGYAVYADHPEHVKVKEILADLTTEAAVVDWGA